MDGTSDGLLRPAIVRHWRVGLAVAAVSGLILTLALAQLDVRSYKRRVAYLVSTSVAGAPTSSVNPNTDRAARDYASVIQQDDRLVDALARVVHRTTAAVGDRMRAVYVPGSSVIAVTYRGSSAAEVRAFFTELDSALTAGAVVGLRLPPGVIKPLNADSAITAERDPLRRHPALGLLGGVVLGLGVAIGRERSSPRVVTVANLQAATTQPVVEYLPESIPSGEAVARRSLAGRTHDRIVVRPLSWRSAEAAQVVTDVIKAAAEREGDASLSVQLRDEPGTTDDAQDVLVVTSDEPLRPFVQRASKSPRSLVVFVRAEGEPSAPVGVPA